MSEPKKARQTWGKRQLLGTFVMLSALGAGTIAMAGPASATVTSVTGRAYGFYSKISLFGGAPSTCGYPATTPCPRPLVVLPAGGSATALTKSQASEDLKYGIAHVLDSGPIHVSTRGTTGSTGSVTSSSHLAACITAIFNGCNVGEVYAGPFTAGSVSSPGSVASTCTDSGSTGFTASTTIIGGKLRNGSGVYTIPTHPAPNKTYTGVNPDTGATYRFVFNQQTVNPNGSHTVTAVHEYLNAQAKGNLTFGTVVCGVN
jgi:hypothetical protein